MMVLWEEKEVVTRHLKERLFLDSGTLTPVLKKLEEKGFISKERSKEDARDLIVTITKKGEALKNEAMSVPSSIGTCISDFKHQKELKVILDEMMQMFESRRNNKTK
jgi:DNA-binding MarR family transcriptional regulator